MIGLVLAMAMAAAPQSVQGRWDIVSVNGKAAAGARVAISEDRVGGRACNSFGGPYAFEGERLKVVPGDFLVGGGECDTAEGTRTEQLLLDALRAGPTASAAGDKLVLKAPDDQVFEFRRVTDDGR